MISSTRRAIMDSLLKLLDERPLSKISVKDIVVECGISRNTFYYHFQDLPDLIEAMVREEADRIMQEYADIRSLEQCLEFIDTDELLEVTPKNLRMRKKILDARMRKRAGNK